MKGGDMMKVASLQQLAKDFEFDIYLGLCEVANAVTQKKEVSADQECQSYKIKHAVDASGAVFDVSFLQLSSSQTMPPFDIAMWEYFEGKYRDFVFDKECDCKYCTYSAAIFWL